MKIYHGLENIDNSPKVVTLGNFDGVHKGHVELISKAVSLGEEKGLPSYVLSFYPHPKLYFKEKVEYINTLDEKSERISQLGIGNLLIMEFNRYLAGLSKNDFVKEILYEKMNAKFIVVGFDFLFGKNRQGNVESLKEAARFYQMEVCVLPPVMVKGEIVSSSLIRELFSTGQVEKAKLFLGYYPKISGQVIPGKQMGRTINYPTANINYNKEQLIPANGVYKVIVNIKGIEYLGMANVGVKPTVKENKLVEIEVHIINFSQDIYGEEISVSFIKKVRDETKFSSLSELKSQIENDIKKILK